MKTSKKKRKTFDMTKKRVQGTEAETFVLKPKKGGRVSIFSSTFLCYTFNKKESLWQLVQHLLEVLFA